MTGVGKMSLDEYLELVQRQTRAETQLTTFCDVLLKRAWMGPTSRRLRYDEEYIDQMLEEYGYDVKGRIEELSKEYDKDHEDHDLEPITIPEGVDDDLPFV
jgi:hypothetical protein